MTTAHDNNRLDPLADALTALANANIINRPSDPAQELEYAAVSAAVAQAVALERIAECLESFLEAYTDTLTAEPSRYPEPDWDNAPEWAHWWAVEPDGEECGSAHWYAEQPSIADSWWNEPTSSRFCFDETVNLPLGCDWRLTLRKRLEVTK